MPLLIKNGEIVTASERYVADIWCAGETITQIGRDLPLPPGATVVDATGHYVFPGFIDPHVHLHLPFMGTLAKDNYTTGSRAALLGGTTTLIEMVCPARGDDALAAYELWADQAAGRSACDYTFHMGVTRFDAGTPAQLREIVGRGVASFKIFLAYQGAFGINDPELYHTLKLARELGVIVTAHCENATLVAERQAELLAAGRTGLVVLGAGKGGSRHHAARKDNLGQARQMVCGPADQAVLARARGPAHKDPAAGHGAALCPMARAVAPYWSSTSAMRKKAWPGPASTNRHRRSSSSGQAAFNCATGFSQAAMTRRAVAASIAALRLRCRRKRSSTCV